MSEDAAHPTTDRNNLSKSSGNRFHLTGFVAGGVQYPFHGAPIVSQHCLMMLRRLVYRLPTILPPPQIDGFVVLTYALYFAQTMLFGR